MISRDDAFSSLDGYTRTQVVSSITARKQVVRLLTPNYNNDKVYGIVSTYMDTGKILLSDRWDNYIIIIDVNQASTGCKVFTEY